MERQKFNISINLRTLRKIKGITAKNVHEATDIPVHTYIKYETNYKMPSLRNLISLSTFFEISIDYLLRWDKCYYPRSIKMLSLAKQIDKMDESKHYQVITTANTLLGEKSVEYKSLLDNSSIELSSSINKNIKLIREHKVLQKKELAEKINILPTRVFFYEKDQNPKAETLIKLSDFFNFSIHSICTGKKLFYHFVNGALLDSILKADSLLSLEDKETVIKIMQKIALNAKIRI